MFLMPGTFLPISRALLDPAVQSPSSAWCDAMAARMLLAQCRSSRMLILACATVAVLGFDVHKMRDMKQIVAPAHKSIFEQELEKDASSFGNVRATKANPCIVGPWGDWGACTASPGSKGKQTRTRLISSWTSSSCCRKEGTIEVCAYAEDERHCATTQQQAAEKLTKVRPKAKGTATSAKHKNAGTSIEYVAWPEECGDMAAMSFRWCACGRVMDGLCPTELCKRCNTKARQDQVASSPDTSNTEYVLWPSHCGKSARMDITWCPCGRVMGGKRGDCPTSECENCAVTAKKKAAMKRSAKQAKKLLHQKLAIRPGTSVEYVEWPAECGNMASMSFEWCPCGRVMDGLCPTTLCKRCGKKGIQDKVAEKPDTSNVEYVLWPSHCGKGSRMDITWCPCGRVMGGQNGDCPTSKCEQCMKPKVAIPVAMTTKAPQSAVLTTTAAVDDITCPSGFELQKLAHSHYDIPCPQHSINGHSNKHVCVQQRDDAARICTALGHRCSSIDLPRAATQWAVEHPGLVTLRGGPLSKDVHRRWNACQKPCIVGNWGGWNACSKSCGSGEQKRLRDVPQTCCTRTPAGTEVCTYAEDERRCNTQPCEKIACRLGTWGAWGKCNRSCGGGQALRRRHVPVSCCIAENGASSMDDCPSDADEKPCSTHPCPIAKVHENATRRAAEKLRYKQAEAHLKVMKEAHPEKYLKWRQREEKLHPEKHTKNARKREALRQRLMRLRKQSPAKFERWRKREEKAHPETHQKHMAKLVQNAELPWERHFQSYYNKEKEDDWKEYNEKQNANDIEDEFGNYFKREQKQGRSMRDVAQLAAKRTSLVDWKDHFQGYFKHEKKDGWKEFDKVMEENEHNTHGLAVLHGCDRTASCRAEGQLCRGATTDVRCCDKIWVQVMEQPGGWTACPQDVQDDLSIAGLLEGGASGTKPVITLIGSAVERVRVIRDALGEADAWSDPGAHCVDQNNGEDISPRIIETGDTVLLGRPGNYHITYQCRNKQGIWANSVTREVRVSEEWSPGCTKLTLQSDDKDGRAGTYVLQYERCEDAMVVGLHAAEPEGRCVQTTPEGRPVYKQHLGKNWLYYHMPAGEKGHGFWRVDSAFRCKSHHAPMELPDNPLPSGDRVCGAGLTDRGSHGWRVQSDAHRPQDIGIGPVPVHEWQSSQESLWRDTKVHVHCVREGDHNAKGEFLPSSSASHSYQITSVIGLYGAKLPFDSSERAALRTALSDVCDIEEEDITFGQVGVDSGAVGIEDNDAPAAEFGLPTQATHGRRRLHSTRPQAGGALTTRPTDPGQEVYVTVVIVQTKEILQDRIWPKLHESMFSEVLAARLQEQGVMVTAARVEVVDAPRLQMSVLLRCTLLGLGATAALIGIIYRLMCVLDQRKQTYRMYTPADAGDVEVDTMSGVVIPSVAETDSFAEQSNQCDYDSGGVQGNGTSSSDSDDTGDFRDAEVEEPV